jgi:pimeloyl-ACP methyl ester carboxylesterase
MPTADLSGIDTEYDVHGDGDGPPILMFSPGGFNAVRENWRTLGVYRRLDLIEQLQEHARLITFDRRESGRSGGRVERVGWDDYVEQGIRLLDHLGIPKAVLMGGCIGCSVAARAGVTHPDRVMGLILYSPAGGARYRLSQHQRFARHLSYVAEAGLSGVVELARSGEETFTSDPRVGPWSSIIRSDAEFAERYAASDPDRYRDIVAGIARLQFDRDSVPGVEPEDLLVMDIPTLVVPGDDASHARSAAYFLHECIPQSELWDMSVPDQSCENAPARIVEFLSKRIS